MTPAVDRPRVVIVGGGFGGLNAAKELRRAPIQLTVVDRRNHHLFQPLLYQVATAALNPSDIAAPIRHILRRSGNTEVILGEVQAIDVAVRRLRLADGDELPYDQLIVATGAGDSYFGHPEWRRLAPSLKTVEDALEIRRRVLYAFERAERQTDPLRQRAWMTFIIVGGGATGVELAGALAEISRHTLAHEFRHIKTQRARVILLEAAPRVLPGYHPRLSESARRQLLRLGVDVREHFPVTAIDEEGVTASGERILARTVLWAAGVAASPLARSLGVPLDRAGRVLVEPDLTVPGHPEIRVVGDLAFLRQQDGQPVPGVAPAAIQQGRHAARGVLRALRGQPPVPFRYRDKGSLATIGRRAAVGQIGRLRLSGMVAWLAWIFVHIAYLIGFRNRVAVLLEWFWSYLTFERGARLITDPTGRLGAGPEQPSEEAPTEVPPSPTISGDGQRPPSLPA
jgi:NADH:ubiquinone reductase (H+-translocating)